MKHKATTNSQGFTLIELLVVISIATLLGSILLVSFNNARKRGRDARRVADIQQVDKGIQLYINDFGHAPYLGSMNCSAEGNYCPYLYDYDTNWTLLKTDLAAYISFLPKDPCGKKCAGPNSLYLTYFYLSPGYLAGWCASIGCSLSPNKLDQMYVIGAERLEATGARWGNNHGFLSSF